MSPCRGRRLWSAKVHSRFQRAFHPKLRAKAGRKASRGGMPAGPESAQRLGRKAQPGHPHQAELPEPSRSRNVEEERAKVAQIQEPLARGRLADTGGSRPLRHRDVDDAQLGNADQQLEQDLEAHRAELDPVDQRSAAEEVPRERIGALTRFAEEHPGGGPRSAADQVARQSGEAAGIPPRHVPACLQESRSRQKIHEPPARRYPDCPRQPRWSRVPDRKRGVTKRAQFSAEGQKRLQSGKIQYDWCRSPRNPLVAKTTARNRAARLGQRLLAAESALAVPNHYMLLSAVWSFPESLRHDAGFHSPQKLFAAEPCLRAQPETARVTPVQRAAAPLRENQERRCRQKA